MWYSEALPFLFQSLGSTKDGLSAEEAEKRLEKYGRNELEGTKKKSFPRRFFAAMCDRMTLVLLVAAAISFVSSFIGGESTADPIIILIIVVVNALIAVIQESRASRALEALKRMSSPETSVLRDGRKTSLPSALIVPGDIILLEKGDVVPCDARLIECNELLCDESALTGESSGVWKSLAEGNYSTMHEAKNCVFSSAGVISGRGRALAVKTGMDSSVGRIASLLTGEAEKTPLQKRLAKLSLLLGNLTIGICLMIFVLSLIKGMPIGEMFLTGVSLSVAAIPEGLPAIVTVVLSVGVQTMAHRNAIVKRLPAVETLGCASVICSDKTGTLTCNRMTVSEMCGDREKLLLAFALCNNDSSPTETALTNCCPDAASLRKSHPRISEIPFDSRKKYMVTLCRDGSGYVSVIKGAPDVIASFCRGGMHGFEGELRRMTSLALRVMGFAVCFRQDRPTDPLRQEFEFIGLCGIHDPLRPEVPEAVKQCRSAGIRPVMITGDHPDTALATAVKLGMAEKSSRVATESDIASSDDRELCGLVKECSVFARVTPESKLRIVEALRQNGSVVAMTGDGVNDAPALKKADIGCAMGQNGTEVAKEAADMILTDDNFATVVAAVKEGRGVYNNIRRAVHFLLSCNIGELFTVFFAILISLPSPLSAIQLLWVNLTTDSLPAIALGLEKTPDSVMSRPPVKRDSPLFSAFTVMRMIFEGILIGTLALTAFAIGNVRADFLTGRTMCFTVLAVSQLFHSFNMRSEKSLFAHSTRKNPYVFASFFICFAMQASVILIPGARILFGVACLGALEWAICIGLSTIPIIICESYKLAINTRN